MQHDFTNNAREALQLAEKCARSLKQAYVGTEHILAGLLMEGTGVAAKVLHDNGVELSRVQDMIRELIAFDKGISVQEREGMSPRTNEIVEEAHRQAERFGQSKTGTEHLLLALIKDGDNVAIHLLGSMNANVQKIYSEVLVAMGQDGNPY